MLQAVEKYLSLVGDGILVHGPLLGWAKMMGDEFYEFEQKGAVQTLKYTMPRRHGVTFENYPWNDHAKDAVAGARHMLQHMGAWSYPAENVQGAGVELFKGSTYERNSAKRRAALEGVSMPAQMPLGVALVALDEESLKTGTYEFLGESSVPRSDQQFFSLAEAHVSVWMQTKGEFFWIFTRTGPGNMKVYKVAHVQSKGSLVCSPALEGWGVHLDSGLVDRRLVDSGLYATASQVMGETRDNIFTHYEVRPVPPGNFGAIGQYTIQYGLYDQQGDELYCLYMVLCRPSMDSRATRQPKLHMWRCSKYPGNVKELIERQAFDAGPRRDQPHWTVEGPSPDSYEGWVWSNGDGWYWTLERKWFELVPRLGRGTPWTPSRAGPPDQAAGGVGL